MNKYIEVNEALEVFDLMYDKQESKDDPYNVGVMSAINYIKHKAPIFETKEIRYFDEEEKAWKVGEVIVNRSENPNSSQEGRLEQADCPWK